MNAGALVPVVVASLVGSLHCASMCGGFVASYAGRGREAGARWPSHLAYNAARLVTYSTLGALAGALGGALDFAGKAAGLSRIAALVTGVLLVLLGVAKLVRRPRLIALRRRAPGGPLRFLGGLLARAAAWPKPLAAGLLGLGSTLLPCGWLYAFAIVAASSGSAAHGAAIMAAFWLGSIPALLGLGLSLGWLGGRLRQLLPRLSAALLVALGMATLVLRSSPAFAAKVGSPALADERQACPFHRKATP